MKQPALFITGTDTGVGKTVLTTLLTRFLRERGLNVAALKPVCSGGRADARLLHLASEGVLSLDEINPWHFRAAVAPVLAARRERKQVRLADVLAHLREMQERFEIVLVEGAGGLLSPLGDHFHSRDLIGALRATPVVVCPNRLGAVNQVLLTLEALPHGAAAKARVVLVSSRGSDASTRTNFSLLAEYFDRKRIFPLPWLGREFDFSRALRDSRVQQTVQKLLAGF